MKRLILLALVVAGLAHAQDEDPTVTAERARLKAARNQAEATYRAAEKACYGKFAVNNCIAAAKAKRREAVSDLRRQEIALNDAQRKRNAAERRRELDEKAAQQRERESAAPARAASPPQRAPRAAEPTSAREAEAKAAKRDQDVKQRIAEQDAAKRRRDAEAAENAKQHARRVADAKAREERVRKRTAERTKPPASSLKDPG